MGGNDLVTSEEETHPYRNVVIKQDAHVLPVARAQSPGARHPPAAPETFRPDLPVRSHPPRCRGSIPRGFVSPSRSTVRKPCPVRAQLPRTLTNRSLPIPATFPDIGRATAHVQTSSPAPPIRPTATDLPRYSHGGSVALSGAACPGRSGTPALTLPRIPPWAPSTCAAVVEA